MSSAKKLAKPEKNSISRRWRGLRPLEGYIGPQNHSDNDIVFFREVAVKRLKE